MPTDFTSIQNYYEHLVFEAVLEASGRYPAVKEDQLADVACVALNRLPARYIRHKVDFAFYQTEKERADTEASITEAISYAFEFVQARAAMRARR